MVIDIVIYRHGEFGYEDYFRDEFGNVVDTALEPIKDYLNKPKSKLFDVSGNDEILVIGENRSDLHNLRKICLTIVERLGGEMYTMMDIDSSTEDLATPSGVPFGVIITDSKKKKSDGRVRKAVWGWAHKALELGIIEHSKMMATDMEPYKVFVRERKEKLSDSYKRCTESHSLTERLKS